MTLSRPSAPAHLQCHREAGMCLSALTLQGSDAAGLKDNVLQGLVVCEEGQALLERLVPDAAGSDQAECACAHVDTQLRPPEGASDAAQASPGALLAAETAGEADTAALAAASLHLPA